MAELEIVRFSVLAFAAREAINAASRIVLGGLCWEGSQCCGIYQASEVGLISFSSGVQQYEWEAGKQKVYLPPPVPSKVWTCFQSKGFFCCNSSLESCRGRKRRHQTSRTEMRRPVARGRRWV